MTMSKRFSSRLSDGVGHDVQSTLDVSKSNIESVEQDGADTRESFVEEDSFQLNEIQQN